MQKTNKKYFTKSLLLNFATLLIEIFRNNFLFFIFNICLYVHFPGGSREFETYILRIHETRQNNNNNNNK